MRYLQLEIVNLLSRFVQMSFLFSQYQFQQLDFAHLPILRTNLILVCLKKNKYMEVMILVIV